MLFPSLPKSVVCCLLLHHILEVAVFSGLALAMPWCYIMVWSTRSFETNTLDYQREHLFEQAAEGFTVTLV